MAQRQLSLASSYYNINACDWTTLARMLQHHVGGSRDRLYGYLTALGRPLLLGVLLGDIVEQSVLTASEKKNTMPLRPYTNLHSIEHLRILSNGRFLQSSVRISGMGAYISLLKAIQSAPVLLHMQAEPDPILVAVALLYARTVYRIPVRCCSALFDRSARLFKFSLAYSLSSFHLCIVLLFLCWQKIAIEF